MDDVIIGNFCPYYLKQIDCMLPCICSVIDHRRHQNVVRISVTHLPARVPLFRSYHIFDIICDVTLQMHSNMEAIC